MQTLQQELDPTRQRFTAQDHPVLRGLVADQTAAHAEEVRLLRQRVAALETALAAAKATQATPEKPVREAPPLTSVDFAPPCRSQSVSSEFTVSTAPAVVAVAVPAPTESEASDELVSDPGFAQAWHESETSFEERIAEKAFFQGTSVDTQSREWLLTK